MASLHKLNVEIMRLAATDMQIEEIASVLSTTSEHVIKIITRDKSRIKDDPRAKDSLEMYKVGYTYEEIGQKYKVTRERVRQILKKQVGYDLGYGPLEQIARKVTVELAVGSLVDFSREDRRGDLTEKKVAAAQSRGIEAQYFDSVRKYCMLVGVNVQMLNKRCPEVYAVVNRNQNIRLSRWNKYYNQCTACGTTTVKYRSNGYCEECYPKSEHFKGLVQRSYLKNRETKLKANKRYYGIYKDRPEVIERLEREYDEKYFGGNRKLALQRDGYKCLNCGMKTNVRYKSGKNKVRVWHLDGIKDNSLENLGTYDQSCFYNKYGAPRQGPA